MGYHVSYQSTDGITLNAIAEESDKPKAVVLMLHGINADNDEEGLFRSLSRTLVNEGYNSFRFDFRAHGSSGGKQKFVTIAGETEDYCVSLKKVRQEWGLPVIVVAASFGAVSFLNSYTKYRNDTVQGVVLLNPVLDLQATFLNSKFPQFQKSFSQKSIDEIKRKGYVKLDGKLKICKDFFEEIQTMRPYENLPKINVPVLLIHGDKDVCVPIELSLNHISKIRECKLVTIKNANHGFERKEEESKVISTVCAWLKTV